MRAVLLTLALALLPFPGAAGCRLALVMAMDISRSVSPTDFRVSRDGLVAALLDPEVRRAALASGPVALSVFDWHEPGSPRIVLPWRLVGTPQDLDRAAAEVAGWTRPPRVGLTALGEALAFARDWLAGAPACDARIIDVAGDGRPNAGPSPRAVYARGGFDGIQVNALVVGEHEAGLEAWFAAEVIRGPGAFVEYTLRHSDFPRAIRRKLIRELSPAMVGALSP